MGKNGDRFKSERRSQNEHRLLFEAFLGVARVTLGPDQVSLCGLYANKQDLRLKCIAA